MAMFMYVYKVFVSLLVVLVHCEITVELATQGPLRKICTTTWYQANLAEVHPLAKEDGSDELRARLDWPTRSYTAPEVKDRPLKAIHRCV
ncbi:hypothetical protein K7X08_032764 [Anisodus acutangulus]|uniref:Secreted protein n=1 Tax=Anisodus acutangulus TaxID=402998 RepID=A0A9Q1M223_9SOLA|nr:hypothetical protein K7X08_032764 [Anisodus acutangulus]